MSDTVSAGFTADDLAMIASDRHRVELIEGSLVVNPSPGLGHQDVVFELALRLRAALRDTEYHVVIAPFDVALDDRTIVVPDIVVAPRSDFGENRFLGTPTLVVEARSPSTAAIDAILKRATYQRAGVMLYWLVDPGEPSITVLQLVAGTYLEMCTASGDEVLEVDVPVPMRLNPSSLRP